MIMESMLSIVSFLSTPAGLTLQSLLITFLVISSLSLLNSAKNQIVKKDLQQTRISILVVLFLNICATCVYFFETSELLALPGRFYDAFHQLVWCLNLILIGWLWIKSSHQSQVRVSQRIFIGATTIFFLIEVFQLVEWLFSPIEISVPYSMIWRVFEFIISITLFFIYLSNFKEASIAGFIFVLLQIFSLGADTLFIISSQFAQAFFQLLAFLTIPAIFLVMEFNPTDGNNSIQDKPIILSENLTVIPNSTLINAWMQTALVNDASLLPFVLCRALSNTFCSDCCLILQISKSKTELRVICGYSTRFSKQILPQAVLSNEEIITQDKSVLFHQIETFPGWMKELLKKIHHIHSISGWYTPLQINNEKYLVLFLSSQDQWGDAHISYLKKIMPELVQILHAYFSEEPLNLPEHKPEKTSANPFLDLMQSEINHKKDIQDVEAELQLALEEYNRIRKILEERGIGQ